MKLLCIASASYRGGATISLINTLIGLKNKGVDILVLTPTHGFLCDIMAINSIKYEIIPMRFSVWPKILTVTDFIKFPGRLLKAMIINKRGYNKIKKIAENWNPDIIHTNVSVINIGYKVAKKIDIPHLWHIREYGDKDFDLKLFPSKKIYRKQLMRSYTIPITKDLQKYYGLIGKKSTVIYNGIEEPFPIEISNLKKENKILYVGRLERNKGATEIIEIFIKFLNFSKSYTLEMIGSCEDNYQKELERLIKSGGATDYIKLIGHQTDIYTRMQEAKALIVPSRCEGFGRITAEAMLNGCLVLGRNTGGTKEQFDNGKNLIGEEIGLRFNNKEELIDQIKLLTSLKDSTYYHILANAQKVVRKLYSVEQNVNHTYNFLKAIKK